MDREDVVAGLRKRFGSVAAFERAQNLPAKSVSDVLRDRKSARVKAAIDKALATPLSPITSESEVSDHSRAKPSRHSLNVEAR